MTVCGKTTVLPSCRKSANPAGRPSTAISYRERSSLRSTSTSTLRATFAEMTTLPPPAIRSRANANSSDRPTRGQRSRALGPEAVPDLPMSDSRETVASDSGRPLYVVVGHGARNRQRATEALAGRDPYRRRMDRTEALQALPDAYAIALRLRDEGVEPDAVARILDVEPEAVGPLLTLAEAKLAGLMETP